MEKKKETSIYLIALVGIVGYIIFNKMKKDKEAKALLEDKTKDIDVFDASFYTKERGTSYVSKELYENKDPEFMEYVRHLQQKLNVALDKMQAKDFPFYPLNPDGLLGYKTALGIVRVFGEGYVPIKDKKTIVYLTNNFQ
tara:strand:+ start:848 stop:1267 length:420 start_codon:yes stop_codon:yes gene_type:complete